MISFFVFILGAFLPVGLSKHWLTSSSLVNGVLVDYLMPDLWLQDILATAIVLLFLKRHWSDILGKEIKRFVLPVGLIIVSLCFSTSSLLSVIYFLRFLLVVLVGKIILKSKQEKCFRLGLKVAVFWTLALALAQVITQKTVLSWQFLGEPVFSPGTTGIKKFILLGRKWVVPMATFPHASVLGVFGLFAYSFFGKDKWARLASVLLVLLSFSLPVYLSFLFLCFFQWPEKKNRYLLGALGLLFFLFLVKVLNYSSIYRRWQLIIASLKMFKNNWLLGVGWGVFVKELPEYLPKGFHFFQPVHNIYLLALSELGIVGVGGLIVLIKRLAKGLKSNWKILAIISFLSLFDHYFWTTTQGLYISAFWIFALGRINQTP